MEIPFQKAQICQGFFFFFAFFSKTKTDHLYYFYTKNVNNKSDIFINNKFL